MKKVYVTIGTAIVVILGWFFAYKPVPPFAGVTVSPAPVIQSPTYFAETDANGNVLRVIVATQQFIDSGAVGDPKNWIETKIDGSLRKNYASKGYKYDKANNAFIPPKPNPDWVLDTEKYEWKDPNPISKTASI